jgi:hypothetical protein
VRPDGTAEVRDGRLRISVDGSRERSAGTMMLHFASMFVAQAILVVACSGSDASGSSTSNQRDGRSTGGATHAGGGTSIGGGAPGGATGSGGASSGGVTSSAGSGGSVAGGCRFDSDCPALGCSTCPASYCMNGQCVWGSVPSNGRAGSGGGAGSGGSAGLGGSGDAGAGGSDEDGGTIPCGNTTCKADELCVDNACGGAPILCQPRDGSGNCAPGLQFNPSCRGCSPPPCTPPPPYCARIPSTCTTVPTEATGCTCANSVCRIGSCQVVSDKRRVHCDAV